MLRHLKKLKAKYILQGTVNKTNFKHKKLQPSLVDRRLGVTTLYTKVDATNMRRKTAGNSFS